MDYKVIVVRVQYDDDAARELEEEVKNHINEGWKPLGGVSTSISGNGIHERTIMSQAMIKEE